MGNIHWSDEELQFLRDNYKTKTYKELSQYLDRSKSAIDLKINRLGLKKSKYIYNHDFFEQIDTQEKAYWLGFIFADGCVCRNETNNSCELCIKLQDGDYKHLQKFNKSICGNVQVDKYERKSNFNNKTYHGCQIRLYSEKIVNDLNKYGVHPNKSLDIEFPDIDENLISHYVRGYFDGDGCITQRRQKNGFSYDCYVQCDFTCGSINFVNQLRSVLFKFDIKSYIVQEKSGVYRLRIGGMKNCDNFLKFIYKDANIYLERKFKKKNTLYEELHIEQRLLRQSEKTGSFNLSEKENGNAETQIRMEGYI